MSLHVANGLDSRVDPVASDTADAVALARGDGKRHLLLAAVSRPPKAIQDELYLY